MAKPCTFNCQHNLLHVGEPRFFILMGLQTFLGWGFGLAIHHFRGRRLSKTALILGLVTGLGGLGYYKYWTFIATSFAGLTGLDFAVPNILLPLGISFYTFQILSYIIDLYRNRVFVQKNILTFATYVMLFPQLIAGPIVRYGDIQNELSKREHSGDKILSGAGRFVLGLGKKVLIANTMGELVEHARLWNERTVLAVWLYVLAFAFQLYFDFSGYSDMAIGLGRIFGFDFMENFNYPYISKSVTEFWRRWHISLSSWFRDYVYIPLGGNRRGRATQIRNILIVWTLTGVWHGAGWNFLLWGAYFGVLLIFEKFCWGHILEKLTSFLRHVYLILCIAVGWTIFALPFYQAFQVIKLMAGVGSRGLWGDQSLYYLRSYAVPLCIAAIGSTPVVRDLWTRLSHRYETFAGVLKPIAMSAMLLVITGFLVEGSFNPFIYFRF